MTKSPVPVSVGDSPEPADARWSLRDEVKFCILHSQHGNKWPILAQHFGGESDGIGLRNTFHSTLRAKSGRRDNFLRSYIRNMGLAAAGGDDGAAAAAGPTVRASALQRSMQQLHAGEFTAGDAMLEPAPASGAAGAASAAGGGGGGDAAAEGRTRQQQQQQRQRQQHQQHQRPRPRQQQRLDSVVEEGTTVPVRRTVSSSGVMGLGGGRLGYSPVDGAGDSAHGLESGASTAGPISGTGMGLGQRMSVDGFLDCHHGRASLDGRMERQALGSARGALAGVGQGLLTTASAPVVSGAMSAAAGGGGYLDYGGGGGAGGDDDHDLLELMRMWRSDDDLDAEAVAAAPFLDSLMEYEDHVLPQQQEPQQQQHQQGQHQQQRRHHQASMEAGGMGQGAATHSLSTGDPDTASATVAAAAAVSVGAVALRIVNLASYPDCYAGSTPSTAVAAVEVDDAGAGGCRVGSDPAPGQSSGMGHSPSMGLSPGTGQSLGMGQSSGMGLSPGTGPSPDMGHAGSTGENVVDSCMQPGEMRVVDLSGWLTRSGTGTTGVNCVGGGGGSAAAAAGEGSLTRQQQQQQQQQGQQRQEQQGQLWQLWQEQQQQWQLPPPRRAASASGVAEGSVAVAAAAATAITVGIGSAASSGPMDETAGAERRPHFPWGSTGLVSTASAGGATTSAVTAAASARASQAAGGGGWGGGLNGGGLSVEAVPSAALCAAGNILPWFDSAATGTAAVVQGAGWNSTAAAAAAAGAQSSNNHTLPALLPSPQSQGHQQLRQQRQTPLQPSPPLQQPQLQQQQPLERQQPHLQRQQQQLQQQQRLRKPRSRPLSIRLMPGTIDLAVTEATASAPSAAAAATAATGNPGTVVASATAAGTVGAPLAALALLHNADRAAAALSTRGVGAGQMPTSHAGSLPEGAWAPAPASHRGPFADAAAAAATHFDGAVACAASPTGGCEVEPRTLRREHLHTQGRGRHEQLGSQQGPPSHTLLVPLPTPQAAAPNQPNQLHAGSWAPQHHYAPQPRAPHPSPPRARRQQPLEASHQAQRCHSLPTVLPEHAVRDREVEHMDFDGPAMQHQSSQWQPPRPGPQRHEQQQQQQHARPQLQPQQCPDRPQQPQPQPQQQVYGSMEELPQQEPQQQAGARHQQVQHQLQQRQEWRGDRSPSHEASRQDGWWQDGRWQPVGQLQEQGRGQWQASRQEQWEQEAQAPGQHGGHWGALMERQPQQQPPAHEQQQLRRSRQEQWQEGAVGGFRGDVARPHQPEAPEQQQLQQHRAQLKRMSYAAEPVRAPDEPLLAMRRTSPGLAVPPQSTTQHVAQQGMQQHAQHQQRELQQGQWQLRQQQHVQERRFQPQQPQQQLQGKQHPHHQQQTQHGPTAQVDEGVWARCYSMERVGAEPAQRELLHVSMSAPHPPSASTLPHGSAPAGGTTTSPDIHMHRSQQQAPGQHLPPGQQQQQPQCYQPSREPPASGAAPLQQPAPSHPLVHHIRSDTDLLRSPPALPTDSSDGCVQLHPGSAPGPVGSWSAWAQEPPSSPPRRQQPVQQLHQQQQQLGSSGPDSQTHRRPETVSHRSGGGTDGSGTGEAGGGRGLCEQSAPREEPYTTRSGDTPGASCHPHAARAPAHPGPEPHTVQPPHPAGGERNPSFPSSRAVSPALGIPWNGSAAGNRDGNFCSDINNTSGNHGGYLNARADVTVPSAGAGACKDYCGRVSAPPARPGFAPPAPPPNSSGAAAGPVQSQPPQPHQPAQPPQPHQPAQPPQPRQPAQPLEHQAAAAWQGFGDSSRRGGGGGGGRGGGDSIGDGGGGRSVSGAKSAPYPCLDPMDLTWSPADDVFVQRLDRSMTRSCFGRGSAEFAALPLSPSPALNTELQFRDGTGGSLGPDSGERLRAFKRSCRWGDNDDAAGTHVILGAVAPALVHCSAVSAGPRMGRATSFGPPGGSTHASEPRLEAPAAASWLQRSAPLQSPQLCSTALPQQQRQQRQLWQQQLQQHQQHYNQQHGNEQHCAPQQQSQGPQQPVLLPTVTAAAPRVGIAYATTIAAVSSSAGDGSASGGNGAAVPSIAGGDLAHLSAKTYPWIAEGDEDDEDDDREITLSLRNFGSGAISLLAALDGMEGEGEQALAHGPVQPPPPQQQPQRQQHQQQGLSSPQQPQPHQHQLHQQQWHQQEEHRPPPLPQLQHQRPWPEERPSQQHGRPPLQGWPQPQHPHPNHHHHHHPQQEHSPSGFGSAPPGNGIRHTHSDSGVTAATGNPAATGAAAPTHTRDGLDGRVSGRSVGGFERGGGGGFERAAGGGFVRNDSFAFGPGDGVCRVTHHGGHGVAHPAAAGALGAPGHSFSSHLCSEVEAVRVSSLLQPPQQQQLHERQSWGAALGPVAVPSGGDLRSSSTWHQQQLPEVGVLLDDHKPDPRRRPTAAELDLPSPTTEVRLQQQHQLQLQHGQLPLRHEQQQKQQQQLQEQRLNAYYPANDGRRREWQ